GGGGAGPRGRGGGRAIPRARLGGTATAGGSNQNQRTKDETAHDDLPLRQGASRSLIAGIATAGPRLAAADIGDLPNPDVASRAPDPGSELPRRSPPCTPRGLTRAHTGLAGAHSRTGRST